MSTTTIENMNLHKFDLTTKKVKNYSVAISVLAHLMVLGLVKYGNIFSMTAAPLLDETYIDLGYQTLDEVPEVRPVITKSEEIQDEASEVTSLQKEKSTPSTSTATPTYADVPYYKVKPKYPKDALEAGLEGNVKMSVDILEDGTVENIKVLGGEKVGTFESAATRAVSKYKYKPFTDTAGNPVKKKDHQLVVVFSLKDDVIN